MPSIITHPDNVRLLEGSATAATPLGQLLLSGIPVMPSPYLERTRRTGRIIAPDGIRNRSGWNWRQDRFTLLEESDLAWLLGLGIVREEEEPVFYVLGTSERFKLSGF